MSLKKPAKDLQKIFKFRKISCNFHNIKTILKGLKRSICQNHLKRIGQNTKIKEMKIKKREICLIEKMAKERKGDSPNKNMNRKVAKSSRNL